MQERLFDVRLSLPGRAVFAAIASEALTGDLIKSSRRQGETVKEQGWSSIHKSDLCSQEHLLTIPEIDSEMHRGAALWKEAMVC